MTRPFRFLADAANSTADNDSSSLESIDSDFVVITAALLCAFVCVLGLFAVAHCAWVRRFSFNTASAVSQTANKGLKKKKILRSLPIVTYSRELGEKFTECPICLTEFAMGDDVRVLPQCGHGFHVECIDTWLGSHLSCPWCRQILVASSRCQNCGNSTASSCRSHGGGGGGEDMIRTDDNRFLP